MAKILTLDINPTKEILGDIAEQYELAARQLRRHAAQLSSENCVDIVVESLHLSKNINESARLDLLAGRLLRQLERSSVALERKLVDAGMTARDSVDGPGEDAVEPSRPLETYRARGG